MSGAGQLAAGPRRSEAGAAGPVDSRRATGRSRSDREGHLGGGGGGPRTRRRRRRRAGLMREREAPARWTV